MISRWNPHTLRRIALASLIALMLLSLGFAMVPVNGMGAGAMLSLVKIAILGLILRRVWRADVYAMQWSSMLILLFVAEGVVRAMSDGPPSAAMGAVEAAVAGIYFVAVLMFLRPLKQAAREARR